MADKTKTLKLDDITIDGGTQIRVELDQQHVADLAGADDLEPVIVYHDGSTHWLADGFHRYFAAKHRGDKDIAARIVKGTQREAILFAVGANAAHGLKRTNADKRKAVLTLLQDAEWGKRSDSWIAEKCRVHHETVAAIRRESTCEIASQRTGKDGRKIETKNIGKKSKKWAEVDEEQPEDTADTAVAPKFFVGQAVRISGSKQTREISGINETDPPTYDLVDGPDEVQECELEAVSDTSVPANTPVTDRTGRAIPDMEIVSIFNRASELERLARTASELKGTVTRGAEAKDELFCRIPVSQFQADCSNLHRAIRFSMPYAVCRFCGGEGRQTKSCRCCKGTGWITEQEFKATPKEMQ